MDEGYIESAVNLLEKGIQCLSTTHRMRKKEVKGCAAVHEPLSSFFPIRKIQKQWMDKKTSRVKVGNLVK